MRVGALQGPGDLVQWEPPPRGAAGTTAGLSRTRPRWASASPLCPTPLTGHHVSRECDANLPTECHPCEAGTFMAYRNRETECLLCIQCREGE